MNFSKDAIGHDAQCEARPTEVDADRPASTSRHAPGKISIATTSSVLPEMGDRQSGSDVAAVQLIDNVASVFTATIEAIGLACLQRLASGATGAIYAYPSRRMRSADAAHYMAVSEATFLGRVKVGRYPPGKREEGVRLWLRDDLDDHIDRQFGVVLSGPANDGNEQDPFVARCKGAA